MRKHYPRNKTHTLDFTLDEVEILIEGYCIPGQEPVTCRAPEDCDPGYPGEVEDLTVYLYNQKEKLDITRFLDEAILQTLSDELLDDYCDYDVAAYEGY